MSDVQVKQGKIFAKSGNGKGVALGKGEWYNVKEGTEPFKLLATLEKGTEVKVEFKVNGTFKNVTAIEVVAAPVKKEEAPTEAKQAPAQEPVKTSKTYTSNYQDNPAKTAQIQRGNALNAAASVASGQAFADPDTASEFTVILAERFLNWLRAE
jgi:hypothetical protein